MPLLTSIAQRRRAVAFAIALTSGTPLSPQPYERDLLALFEAGILDLDEVSELLEQSVYQILYHSRATQPPGEHELQAMLEQWKPSNARCRVTGLLLYSDGRYVQVLEGDQNDVEALYAHICCDPRHQQVVTVSKGPAPKRLFADWSMSFGSVAAPAIDRVLDAVPPLHPPTGLRVENAHLQALLKAI